MKVSDYVIEFLILHGIDKIVTYIGDNSTHTFDWINKYKIIKIVSSRHEHTTGFSEEDYDRIIDRTNGTSNGKAQLKICKLRKKLYA